MRLTAQTKSRPSRLRREASGGGGMNGLGAASRRAPQGSSFEGSRAIAAGFSLFPLVGGLFMLILKDPERARQLGLLGAKAQLAAGTADWPTFVGLISQAVAIGGAILFAFLFAWLFGREFADRTVVTSRFPDITLGDRHLEDRLGSVGRGDRRLGAHLCPRDRPGDRRAGRTPGMVGRHRPARLRWCGRSGGDDIALQTFTAFFAGVGRG